MPWDLRCPVIRVVTGVVVLLSLRYLVLGSWRRSVTTSPKPGGHCQQARSSLRAELPNFAHPEDLQRSPEWHCYLSEVYGSSVDDPRYYPIDVSKFAMLYGRRTSSKGLLTDLQCLDRGSRERTAWCRLKGVHNKCPGQVGDFYGCATCGKLGCLWDLHDWVWIYHGPPWHSYPSGLPSNTWVEVTHCLSPRESDGRGTWMYHAKGSGIFVNTGSTSVHKRHKHAFTTFLNQTENCKECDHAYAAILRKARAQGFSTIQFTHHSDMRCGNTHLELVHTVFADGTKLEIPIRCGLNASCECNCKYETNDAGHACPVCTPVCASNLRLPEAPRIAKDGGAVSVDQTVNSSANGWEYVCDLERDRHLLFKQSQKDGVQGINSTEGWKHKLARLKILLNSRFTACLGKRPCTVKDLGDQRVRVCTTGSDKSTFCEVRPSGVSSCPDFVIRKMCRAGKDQRCFDYDMRSISDMYSAMRVALGRQQSLPTCAVVGSGHSLRCGAPAGAMIDSHTSVFRTNNYPSSNDPGHALHMGVRTSHAYRNCNHAPSAVCLDKWTKSMSQLRSRFSGGHSGGFLLDVAIALCEQVDVYGFGMFSYGIEGDVLYQHWYDRDFAPTCGKDFQCFHESATACRSSEFRFYQRFGPQICNRDVVCGRASEAGLPRSEAQVDFFFKSELRLHVLDAFGMINWVWYSS